MNHTPKLQGYMRCAGLSCWNQADSLVADVPVCTEHELALAQKFSSYVPPAEIVVESAALVYYVTWPDLEFVKIGTSTNLHHRLQGLSKPGRRARLLAVEPGGYDVEKERHRQFAYLRKRGTELFRYVDQIVGHVDTVRKAHPNWRELSGVTRTWM
jgi:hypothetical protein